MDNTRTYSGPFAFFSKHFNGDYSLPRSYWVNTFLISMFAPLLGVFLLPWLNANFPARYGSAGFLLVTALGVIAWGWAVIGTWASADKHVGRGGHRVWANAAKVMIVLAIVRTAGDVGNMSGTVKEHWKVAFGRQPGPAIRLQVRADGNSIMLQGGMNDGASDALRKALDLAPTVNTVVLYSTGGWVREGALIAELISERKLHTYVERECTSACTLAFLAGKERAAEPNARIGFHSFRSVGSSDTGAGSFDADAAKEVYRQAGLSETFIDRAVGVSNDKVWYPSHEEMLAEGLLTRESFGGETATIATLIPTREQLAAKLRNVPAFDTLALKYPREFEEVVDRAWAKAKAGKSDAEVLAAGRKQVTLLIGKLLPIASDATLLEFNRLVLDQAEALRRKSAVACVELMFPTGRQVNTAAFLPPELLSRELMVLSDLVRGSDVGNTGTISEQEFERVYTEILGSLTEDQVQMLASEKERSTSVDAACEAIVATFKALNEIPQADRARFLRAMYATN